MKATRVPTTKSCYILNFNEKLSAPDCRQCATCAIHASGALPFLCQSVLANNFSVIQAKGDLAVDLPPCLFPYMHPGDSDWRPRYDQFNRPGEYHNGGVWPFICGFYVAACVAAGRHNLAQARLEALARLVKPWHEDAAEWGFNEQIKAQTGKPIGRDWQTWSAAMFLYAAKCVETHSTPWFDEIRAHKAPTAQTP